ncbi:MAG: hypothetical protein HWN81_00655 [Candidatus Lokiarchaeota archaeon]|nr:hypothetical protein [Candidatus Lokiarchaeota archaeon]
MKLTKFELEFLTKMYENGGDSNKTNFTRKACQHYFLKSCVKCPVNVYGKRSGKPGCLFADCQADIKEILETWANEEFEKVVLTDR